MLLITLTPISWSHFSSTGAKQALEEEWKVLLADYEQAVTTWKVDCDHQKAGGVCVKSLPKKLTRPRNSQMPTNTTASTSKDANSLLKSSSSNEEGELSQVPMAGKSDNFHSLVIFVIISLFDQLLW